MKSSATRCDRTTDEPPDGRPARSAPRLTCVEPYDRPIRAGQTLAIDVPRGRRLCVRATRGTLWVTHPSTREDVILNATESRTFDAGRAVISSLGGPARLAWCMPGAAGRSGGVERGAAG